MTADQIEADKNDPFGKHAHDTQAPTHSGVYGHYCWEWDGLWICRDCAEFKFCECYLEAESTQPPA